MSLNGKYCPKCRAEYIEGWGKCDRCGVALVATLEPVEPAEPIQVGIETDVEDPFVLIWEGPTREGTVFARLLEIAHIPIDVGDALERGHCRIQVPQSYVKEAFETLDRAEPDDVREAMREPVDEPAASDWPFWLRIVLGVIAALIIVGLLLSQA